MTSIVIPTYTQVTSLLTNSAYGFPTGKTRRVSPIALACLHVTSNPNKPPATAATERNYANRTGSGGPSAHRYRNRDGSCVIAIDNTKFAAWSNGDVKTPKTNVPGVAAVLAMRTSGYNANEAYWLEIEHCGHYTDYPITSEQTDATALDIANESILRGLPIERQTVHLHSDLNTETRANCPVPSGSAEAWVESIIDQANVYKAGILERRVIELTAALADSDAKVDDLTTHLAASEKQRDEAVQWGKTLQSFGGAILATDAPDWVDLT